jgi:ribulose 1,5-bisphosphate synthetase/thiazole synthase
VAFLAVRNTLRRFSTECKKDYEVIIAGGGLMGLSSAYFLAVVERDLKVK